MLELIVKCFFLSENWISSGFFPIRISSVNVTKSAGISITFTEEILNGKLHF